MDRIGGIRPSRCSEKSVNHDLEIFDHVFEDVQEELQGADKEELKMEIARLRIKVDRLNDVIALHCQAERYSDRCDICHRQLSIDEGKPYSDF